MDTAKTHPPASIVEGMLIAFFANRRPLVVVAAAILVLALLVALFYPVRYAIEAEVLVTPGPEYTYRPSAGDANAVSQAIDHDQAMHTESAILESADLHRDTLRAIGVWRLYPEYTEGPGLISGTIAAVRGGFRSIGVALGLADAPPPLARDPVELALREFEAALRIDVPRVGSVITVTFRHRDAALGAEALNKMIALYEERRKDLFRDNQSQIVAKQVDLAKGALDDAEAELAQYRLRHNVGAFEAQRDILLRRRGDLQTDRNDAQSQVAQLAVRLDAVTRQLTTVPQNLAASSDTDYEQRTAPARTSLEALRAQYANALVQYRPEAPRVQSLRAEIARREADVAAARRDATPTSVRTGQNPTWLTLQDDRLRTETNLSVQKIRLMQDDLHLKDLNAQIAAFDQSEQALTALVLKRDVAQENYRSASKTLEERRVADDVAANRRTSARVLQPAVPPLYQPPVRRLILAGGVLLAALALAGGTLVAHAFGRTYWQPEVLEQDLGIAVIAVIPELAGAAGRGNPRMLRSS